MSLFLGMLFGLFLAYANGANDNFKGVATLFGSGTTDYKRALIWATVTTALGSVAALFIAQELLHAFSGKGLISDALLSSPAFSISVAFAAGSTVMLATRFGFPISTTHALIGALVGVGLFGSSAGVNFDRLASTFLLPLLLSPFVALAATWLLYKSARYISNLFGLKKETCICIGQEVLQVVEPGTDPQVAIATMSAEIPTVSLGSEFVCRQRYAGKVLGITVDTLIDKMHYLSSGIVGFARGLNDTPKIAAILLAGSTVSQTFAIVAVTVFMAAGALISTRKVAETLSHRITEMDHGQGLSANIVTGFVVIFASKLGMPVSTTHVSSGALFGIGTITGKANWKMIGKILAAWVITLPAAALFGSIILLF